MTAANDNRLGDRLAFGVADAAAALSVGQSTVWRWIQAGQLRTIKLGGRTLIRREELVRLLDEAA